MASGASIAVFLSDCSLARLAQTPILPIVAIERAGRAAPAVVEADVGIRDSPSYKVLRTMTFEPFIFLRDEAVVKGFEPLRHCRLCLADLRGDRPRRPDVPPSCSKKAAPSRSISTGCDPMPSCTSSGTRAIPSAMQMSAPCSRP